MVPADHLGRDDLVRRVIALAMREVAIVLEAVGVALIVLALTRDDLQRRYPWLR